MDIKPKPKKNKVTAQSRANFIADGISGEINSDDIIRTGLNLDAESLILWKKLSGKSYEKIEQIIDFSKENLELTEKKYYEKKMPLKIITIKMREADYIFLKEQQNMSLYIRKILKIMLS